MIVTVLLALMRTVESDIAIEKDFCANLQCIDSDVVCGIREEVDGYRLREFDSECELLKYGCSVEHNLAYGIISMHYCEKTFQNTSRNSHEKSEACAEFDCSYPTDAKQVCGIRKDGEGYRIRRFENKCKLWKYSCENKVEFTESDDHICDGMSETKYQKTEENSVNQNEVNKNIIVVDSSNINFKNFNESIENFFAATHVFDLPLEEAQRDMNETSRRMLVNIFGPRVVFKPSFKIPKNISDDYEHVPTLSTCFHKCPRKCPDMYAPVCGVPGIMAREPRLMFLNHCFMDVAQCKMYWEDKSPTAISSKYIDTAFLFCLGEELNSLYRFLPLIRTLQHMGRLKKKGFFRYKMNNMRFFNNLLPRAQLMG